MVIIFADHIENILLQTKIIAEKLGVEYRNPVIMINQERTDTRFSIEIGKINFVPEYCLEFYNETLQTIYHQKWIREQCRVIRTKINNPLEVVI